VDGDRFVQRRLAEWTFGALSEPANGIALGPAAIAPKAGVGAEEPLEDELADGKRALYAVSPFDLAKFQRDASSSRTSRKRDFRCTPEFSSTLHPSSTRYRPCVSSQAPTLLLRVYLAQRA
jgi:hypothetical protein